MSIKQVIVIRKDLKMRRGKECSQAAHASTSFFAAKFFNYNGHVSASCQQTLSPNEQEWLDLGMTKITLQVSSEKELIDLIEKASKAGISCYSIVDKGTTEFGGVPTLTCCAIGPDDAEKIDKITGELKLY